MDRALKGALLATLLVAAGAHAHAASAVPPSCLGKRATIVGTTRADHLRGTPRADVIAALGGDDVVSGLGDADRICGGGGNDHLDGDGGRDTVDGGLGANWCRAERPIALFVDFPDVPAVVPAQEIFDEVFPPAARYCARLRTGGCNSPSSRIRNGFACRGRARNTPGALGPTPSTSASKPS